MNATIKSIIPGSIADDAGLEPGDILLSINNALIGDILDYRFHSASDELVLEVQKQSGDIEVIEIDNAEYEELGIEFTNGLIDKPRVCRNKCMFCFIDQLPKGMRKAVYFKDDDYRLSTLMGNYVTLTNASEDDIERIMSLHLPRINISVHASDPELRARMLGNKKAMDIIAVMRRFKDSGIEMNCQIVLCRGINDGHTLSDTLDVLSRLYPAVQSVSVVPAGLTAHRAGLPLIEPYDRESAIEVISRLTGHQRLYAQLYGTPFAYAADEFYVISGMPLPPSAHYGDFLQLENGVGLMALLQQDFMSAYQTHRKPAVKSALNNITIVTGVGAAPFLARLMRETGFAHVHVIPIVNSFFGGNVDVAGLVTGGDIIAQLKSCALVGELIIPRCMLNSDGLFLDDTTPDTVADALGVNVTVVDVDGAALFNAII